MSSLRVSLRGRWGWAQWGQQGPERWKGAGSQAACIFLSVLTMGWVALLAVYLPYFLREHVSLGFYSLLQKEPWIKWYHPPFQVGNKFRGLACSGLYNWPGWNWCPHPCGSTVCRVFAGAPLLFLRRGYLLCHLLCGRYGVSFEWSEVSHAGEEVG